MESNSQATLCRLYEPPSPTPHNYTVVYLALQRSGFSRRVYPFIASSIGMGSA